MHAYRLVYQYVHVSLDFARTLCGVWQTYSVRLKEGKKGGNPTHHRPIEKVNLISTIKFFHF